MLQVDHSKSIHFPISDPRIRRPRVIKRIQKENLDLLLRKT